MFIILAFVIDGRYQIILIEIKFLRWWAQLDMNVPINLNLILIKAEFL